MLFLSLVMSAFVLVLGTAAYRYKGMTAVASLLGILTGVGVLFAGCLLPAVCLQLLIMGVAWAVCSSLGSRTATYVSASAASTAAAYAVMAFVVWLPQLREVEAARRQVPLESMAARVPAPRTGTESRAFQAPVAERLATFESAIAEAEARERHPWMGRHASLKALHENTTELFVNSPGFGLARIPRPSVRRAERVPDDAGPVRHPGERDASAGAAAGGVVTGADDSSHAMHAASLRDFLDPRLFGYVADRTKVAGFVSHRLTEVPKAPQRWQLQTLDLVGLVMHDQLVAYVSENLPRMDELKNAPTRTLDDFEAEALASLRKGEDLVSRESGGRLRLLGAVRATKQCTTCHGCERGELLGAFSYTLRRGEP